MAYETSDMTPANAALQTESPDLQSDQSALWYKKSIIYELHIRAFYDSNADGIGDIPGLIEKLP